MAVAPRLTNLVANAEADAAAALCNSGYIRIYDGAQPATADTAVTTQNLLAALRFAATAFGAAVAGVATANAVVSDPDAALSGTASWFRVLKSDGTTALFDGDIGTAASDLIMPTTSIVQHAVVSISAFTFTAAKS